MELETPRLGRADVLPDSVLLIRDHLRVRLRIGDAVPSHPAGTDGRSPRPDPDTAYASIYAYRRSPSGRQGTVAVVELHEPDRPAAAWTFADDPVVAADHAAAHQSWGYTPSPAALKARFVVQETADAFAVAIDSEHVRLRIDLLGLGAPFVVSGAHPRDQGMGYWAVMREGGDGEVRVNDRRVAGAVFAHRGYEHWLGRAFSSVGVQLGETVLTRRAASSKLR